jgi:hypothetical protein
MKNQLLNSAKRTLKNTAAATFCICLAASSFAQEPVHAIHHPVGDHATQRVVDETRPAPELALSIFPNPSPTGVFIIKSEDESIFLEVYNEQMVPLEVEIENARPGHFVINMSKFENGAFSLVATSENGQSVRELIKREVNTDLSDDAAENNDKLMDLQINIFPNPTNGIFTVQTSGDEKAIVEVLDRTMQPITAPISNLLNENHRIDLTNYPSDVYFVRVRTKSSMATERIMKR